ncbi:MAG: RraA family protein [Burkholderiaceae bacterium]|nr:RraA family protein [Burkholderiaceae bacterium]
MADKAPALTVRRHFARPTEAQVRSLMDAPTGWVVDANGRRGAIDHMIRPLTRATRFVGVAMTVHTRARDNLAPYAAIHFAKPGDVLVVSADDYQEASVAGDIMLGMAKNKGVVALVTDGVVRDIEGLNAVGIPVFARGLTPNSPHKDGPGEIGTPISLGGVVIEAGDVVVGDTDGVVVVRRESLDAVIAALAAVKAKEAAMDAQVRAGAKQPVWLEQAFADLGVRYLD